MSKLLSLLCLVGLVCFADALTKQEVFHLIHQVGNNVRQEHIPLIKSTIKAVLDEAVTPEQTACTNGYVSETYKDLNLSIGTASTEMRSDYGTMTTAELEAMTEEQVTMKMDTRFRDALKWFPERMKQIRQCSHE